ncbi:hypothetical protein V2J09_012009 [Rumex salicifolius]
MASINLGPFGEHWFQKPPNPLTPLSLLSAAFSLRSSSKPLNFSSLSVSNSSGKNPPNPKNNEPENPGKYKQMLDQYFWECENIPDYRKSPEAESILQADPIFETRENPTEEEIEENKRILEEIRNNPVVKFLAQVEELKDEFNEEHLSGNRRPYRKEDSKLWEAVPHVPGLDGRPMPRKSITKREQSDDKFWDFAKQFFFGLWGYKQRPYPPGRPIDVAQAIGYKQLEKRYYDFIMKTSGWYYKDRLGRTRGPCELIQLKTAWGGGVIDKDTFIWGEDMDEWAPINMVYGLEPAIATWEVRMGASATAFLHRLQKGIPPGVPLKGQEKKTYKQLQDEAIESKKRDLAVLKANDGIWPGVRTPSHTLFLWASGSELTNILEEDHMPNKYIPRDLRKLLAKHIPGLRPWEVLSVEQAMDQITFGGEWYREPLGCYMTGPPYVRHYNKDLTQLLKAWITLYRKGYRVLQRSVPAFDKVEKMSKEQFVKKQARWRNWLQRKKNYRERGSWIFQEEDLDTGYDQPRPTRAQKKKDEGGDDDEDDDDEEE